MKERRKEGEKEGKILIISSIIFFVSSTASSFKSVIPIVQPSLASATANARPSPLPAPVINARLLGCLLLSLYFIGLILFLFCLPTAKPDDR